MKKNLTLITIFILSLVKSQKLQSSQDSIRLFYNAVFSALEKSYLHRK